MRPLDKVHRRRRIGSAAPAGRLAVVALAAGLSLPLAGALATSDQPGGPRSGNGNAWTPGFTLRGLDATVRALAVFDDGSGPAVYAGGLFSFASGEPVDHVARWDGSAWAPLATAAGAGVDGAVYALAVYDDGTGPALYVGGEFTDAGGLPATNIARWRGGSWSALSGPVGEGTDGAVYALAVYDDGSGGALHAGGSFAVAGGIEVADLARWDGSAWSPMAIPLGSGSSESVAALAVHDDGSGPALYVGGRFERAGGVTANNVACWDGSTWSALSGPSGTGTSWRVDALASYDDGSGPALYAAGGFHRAGGVTVENVARWDGSSWSGLSGPGGTGTSRFVRALTVFDDGEGPVLVAAGRFQTAGGIPAHNVACWDGVEWSPLVGPLDSGARGILYALAVFDDGGGPALFAGGSITTAGGVPVSHIARWDDGWSGLEPGPPGLGVSGMVTALQVSDDGSGLGMFAAGVDAAGGAPTGSIARWDGGAWSSLEGPLGTGVDGWISALAVFDGGGGPALFIGGSFTSAGGLTANNVARWDGSGWWPLIGPLAPGTDGVVYALSVYDDGGGPSLYAAGSFDNAGGQEARNIARWDGASWSPLSMGITGDVYALAAFDDGGGLALYAGGWFEFAGGQYVRHIARWDPSGWSLLAGPSGVGVNNAVYALTAYDDGAGMALLVGGVFSTAGGVPANGIARWDGGAWSAVEGPAGNGVSGGVLAFQVHDDGTGPALHAGGEFETAGGLIANNVARWDRNGWSVLFGPSGIGTNGAVWALGSYDDGDGAALYAGGEFWIAGGLPSSRIARWGSPLSRLFADGFESGDTSRWSATVP